MNSHDIGRDRGGVAAALGTRHGAQPRARHRQRPAVPGRRTSSVIAAAPAGQHRRRKRRRDRLAVRPRRLPHRGRPGRPGTARGCSPAERVHSSRVTLAMLIGVTERSDSRLAAKPLAKLPVVTRARTARRRSGSPSSTTTGSCSTGSSPHLVREQRSASRSSSARPAGPAARAHRRSRSTSSCSTCTSTTTSRSAPRCARCTAAGSHARRHEQARRQRHRSTAAIQAGALAFVPKTETADELVAAIRSAATGVQHQTAPLRDAHGRRSRRRELPGLGRQEQRALVLYADRPLDQGGRRRPWTTTGETVKSYIKRARRKYREAGIDLGTEIRCATTASARAGSAGVSLEGHGPPWPSSMTPRSGVGPADPRPAPFIRV